MTRGHVSVREAVPEDATAVARLWESLLQHPADAEALPPEQRMHRSMRRLGDLPDTRVVLAEVDGATVGIAYLRVCVVSPLDAEPTLSLSHLHVDAGHAEHEVRAALLDAALGWADERGITSFVTGSASADRETNRFLARLGLGQVGVLRASTVPALRSRLLREPSAGRLGRATRRTGQVVAARRSQRRTQADDLPF